MRFPTSRALQVLILVVLVQVALFAIVYIKKSWTSNLNWLPDLYDERKIAESSNLTSNAFTKRLPTDDENRLVNLTDFDYKINKDTLCHNQSLLLLVAVSSAPVNQRQRMVIRETWGQGNSEVRIIFMLGVTNDDVVTKTIEAEDKVFGDIIQGNFIDSYKNMTYKSTMALKYAIYNCPGAKFLLKCDDDVFINMPLVKNFLNKDLSVLNATNSIFCTVNLARTPIRDPIGEYRKWYVSYEEWPEENFPMYCSGWYLMMRLDVAFDIYRFAQNSTFFWVDDVFLTGIAGRNIQGLNYVDVTRFTLAYTEIDDILKGNLGDMPVLVGTFNMPSDSIRILWQHVSSKPVEESILDDLFKRFHQNSTMPEQ